MKPKMWFLTPNVQVPSGGINHFYRLCSLAEELGIEAYILSEEPYSHCDPPEISKYWKKIEFSHHYQGKYDHPEILEGDIIIQPEIYNWRSLISKAVRRITYVQNWGLVSPRTWENHYWTYNDSTNLSLTLNNVMRGLDPGPKITLPPDGMHTDNFKEFLDAKRVEWSLVNPYFDPQDFFQGKNDPEKIMMFPRKSSWIVDIFKEEFGDRVLSVDNLPPREVLKLYSEVGTVVLPTPAEGLCFPSIEAMLSGAVVVSWPCGGHAEFLIDGETGVMAKFGDVNDLLQKTKNLLEDHSKMKEIASNAKELISKLFTKEEAKTQLYLAYHRSCSIDPE